MRIIVHDTLRQTRALLDSPLADRPSRLLDLLAPVLPMYAYAPAGPLESHHLGYGFRVDAEKGEKYREALDRLQRGDAGGQGGKWLTQAYAHQPPAPPD